MTKMEHLELSIRSSYSEFEKLSLTIDRFLDENRVRQSASYAAKLVVEELVSNVIRHGTGDSDSCTIDIHLVIEPGRLIVRLADDGREFDPTTFPAPDFGGPPEERAPGGLGIHLVRSLSDEFRYERKEGRNHIEVIVNVPGTERSGHRGE